MSKAHLASLCAWWLRGEVKRPPFKQSTAARKGTDTHSLIEAHLLGLPPPPRPLADAVRNFESWMRGPHPERFLFADLSVETAVRVNFATGEGSVHTLIKARNYPKETDPLVVWGTVDLIVYEAGMVAEVYDWKTGKTRPVAHGNGQLLSLSAALYGAKPFESIRTTIGHISQDEVTESVAPVSKLDVLEWRERMHEVLSGVPSASPQPGPHCEKMFCEQFGKCPATEHLQVRGKNDAA